MCECVRLQARVCVRAYECVCACACTCTCAFVCARAHVCVGGPGALNNLGCLYEHGSELTARDLATAVQYYTAGAQLGCAAAQARESTLEYPGVPYGLGHAAAQDCWQPYSGTAQHSCGTCALCIALWVCTLVPCG